MTGKNTKNYSIIAILCISVISIASFSYITISTDERYKKEIEEYKIQIENKRLGIENDQDQFLCDKNFDAGQQLALKPRDDVNEKDMAQTYDVLVIGAGMSGLEAANQLDRKGVNSLIILEGRDRIGGRVWTGNIDNIPVDLGGSWIHGLDENSEFPNPIYLIANRNNITTVKTTQSTTVYDNNGKKIADESYDLFNNYEQFAEEYSESLTDEQKQKMSVQTVIDKFFAKNNMNADKQKMFQYTMQWYNDMEQAENVTNVSFAKSLETQYYNEDEDNEVIFPQGYNQVVNCLAEGLKEKILHANVTKVDYRSGLKDIRIETNRGNFSAKFVVSTLPIPVLQNKTSMSVKFVPNFDQQKKDAINKIYMGTMDKVYLLYDKPFWSSSSWINRVSDNNSTDNKKWQFFLNLDKYDHKPILLAFNTGESAKRIEKKTDSEIKNEVISAIRTIYPDSPDPVSIKITRWASDPFAGGSYSTLPMTGSVNAADDLAEPIGNKLFFAGEATNKYYYGTVHAAYISGYRAAEEILNVMDNNSTDSKLDKPIEQIRHGIKKWDVICEENEEPIVDNSKEGGVLCTKKIRK